MNTPLTRPGLWMEDPATPTSGYYLNDGYRLTDAEGNNYELHDLASYFIGEGGFPEYPSVRPATPHEYLSILSALQQSVAQEALRVGHMLCNEVPVPFEEANYMALPKDPDTLYTPRPEFLYHFSELCRFLDTAASF